MLPKISIEKLPGANSWHAYRIPLEAPFPVTAEFRHALLPLVCDILAAVRSVRTSQLIGILQYNQLHHGGAGMVAAKKGKEWGLEWGLGYLPEQVPPTLWTMEDFTNLDIGEMPRPVMNQIFGISAGDAAVMAAVDMLLGLGSLVLGLASEPAATVKARATAQFRPLIEEEALRHFGYYFPLFSGASFSGSSATQIENWTCGMTFYLRESPDDKGILIAASEPLEDVFQRLKGRETPAAAFEWLITPQGYAEIR